MPDPPVASRCSRLLIGPFDVMAGVIMLALLFDVAASGTIPGSPEFAQRTLIQIDLAEVEVVGRRAVPQTTR
jgi:hypothetical protein